MNQINKMHLMRALRISLAMLISFIYIRITYVSDGIWIIMTCAIILFDNSTVGGALIKCYYRIMGTIIAAAFSILVVMAFANSTIANLIAVITSVVVAGYYFMDTKKSYIGGLIAWTTPIMLINNHNLSAIFIRPLNIIVGIIICYIVQRLFYPEYAKNLVLKPFIDLTFGTRILLENAITANTDQESLVKRETIELNVIANINKAVKLIDETNSELHNLPQYSKICTDLVLHLRKIMKYIAVFTYQLEDKVIILTVDLQLAIEQLMLVLSDLEIILKDSLQGKNNFGKFDSITRSLKDIEDKYFIKCSTEQLLILKMLTKELLEIDELMLKLLELRQKHKMY